MKSLLRKILPQSTLLKLRSMAFKFDESVFPFFTKHAFLSTVYYYFFSAQFRREQQAVLLGRLRYNESLNDIKNSSVLLRRNTHRLEKGLIMQPRKAVFAEAYIEETVTCFTKCLQSGTVAGNELKWAQDVLTEYFSVVDIQQSQVIAAAKLHFQHLPLAAESRTEFIPYQFSERHVSNVNKEQLYQLFKQRRSVRWYEQKTVPMHLIEQGVEMALQAPSACNRQPFQFYTFTSPKRASEIAAIPMGTKGFSENIQSLIVIVGDLSAYPKERDRHVIYIDGGLVAMQLMLAFETLGLSTCPINWPDMEAYEKKMALELALEPFQRPIMLMAIGYGEQSGKIPYSQKKSAQQVIKEMD